MAFQKTLFFFTALPLLLAIISIATATDIVSDFCVADLTLPRGPTGYLCRNASTVTADDFMFSGLGVLGNTSNGFNLAVTSASGTTFPALNGLGLSMIRLDLGVGGVVPAHTHRTSEITIVIEGTIIAGFMATDDTVFYKTLNKGDIMVFPPSLLHFQVNVGNTNALLYNALNSDGPGFQTTSIALFGNNLPTDLVKKITLVSSKEIKELKRIFGGTN